MFGALALVDRRGIGRDQHVEGARSRSVGDRRGGPFTSTADALISLIVWWAHTIS
jgi:hypothetical protein